jgi:hypothetical protein
MILSQKILQKLITEAISQMEADCLAQLAPAHYVTREFSGRSGTTALAKILMDRASAANKSWGDYVQQHKEMEEMYPGLTEMTSDALADCLKARQELAREEEHEKGEAEERWVSRTREPFKRGPRPAGDDRDTPPADMTFVMGDVRESLIKQMIVEELTKTDKAEIKKMISTEMEKSLKPELKKILQDELIKELGSKKTKEEMGEIAKKVIKKLYKDLSFHHPYIIDRIKV